MSAAEVGAVAAPGMRARIAAMARARLAFDSHANAIVACVAACLLCGLWSLWRGQDSNWDLRNYHLYNAYAALHGRLGLDLAAAQMQSYFNPVLDVLQYGLMMALPAPLAGFLMGAWHGLVFALVAAIGWRVLADDPRRAVRVPWLAFAGLFTAAFFSELGNSMGDNSTAVPVLGALALLLSAQQRARLGQGASVRWLLAGVLLGLAVAFKLTNALYAVALGVAALCDGGRWRARLAGTAAMTLAALACFAIVAGPWFFRVWETFGNPLFPQFNAWFHSPLALPLSVADTRWLPRGLGEWLTWPVVLAAAATGERPGLAAVRLGGAVLCWRCWGSSGACCCDARRASVRPCCRPRAWCWCFSCSAMCCWQLVFSIHRYLVPIEVLLPLLLWWAWPRLLRRPACAGGWR